MISEVGFWDLLRRGDIVMWTLLLCSIVSIGVMINRWLYYRSCRINVQEFFQKFRRGHKRGDDLGSLIVLCDEIPGPLPALLKEGVRRVMEKPVKRDELEAQLQRHARYQVVEMEKFLTILGTIGATAPFIGLLGTVLGVMRAFQDLAIAGSGGATVVAAGIAQALIATAGGLVVAVPESHLDASHEMLQEVVPAGVEWVVTIGGTTRQQSVAAGLLEVPPEAQVVTVHDAARPSIDPLWITQTADLCREFDGAIVAVPAVDTLKEVKLTAGRSNKHGGIIGRTISREIIWQAQTPQTFRTEVLRRALQHEIGRAHV